MVIESIFNLYLRAKDACRTTEEPWTNLLLSHCGIKPLSMSQYTILNDELFQNQSMRTIYTRLHSEQFGLIQLEKHVPDHTNYSSFYYLLSFLAAIGVSRSWINLEPLIMNIFINQQEDGLFTTGYRRRNKLPLSLFCVSAHLTAILSGLGYGDTPNIKASIQYILNTRRRDGSWHCDLLKQRGERDEDAPGCLSANIFALRALGTNGLTDQNLIRAAFDQILTRFLSNERCADCCDLGHGLSSRKLRYPEHYMGLDYLHVLDTLSLFPDQCKSRAFKDFLAILLHKKTLNAFFLSEKSIPAWKKFDFAQAKTASGWITAIICRALKRIYQF
ncbi:hypothetical protein JXB12_02275 [candidate division KSB1 bacterium]|nr:hypothetical protein [candidate division KSB1 bacterium]